MGNNDSSGSSVSQKLESLIKSRRYLSAQVTRIFNQVQQGHDSMTPLKIASHTEKLES